MVDCGIQCLVVVEAPLVIHVAGRDPHDAAGVVVGGGGRAGGRGRGERQLHVVGVRGLDTHRIIELKEETFAIIFIETQG